MFKFHTGTVYTFHTGTWGYSLGESTRIYPPPPPPSPPPRTKLGALPYRLIGNICAGHAYTELTDREGDAEGGYASEGYE